MLIKDIKPLLMGKTISWFDGWNGSHDSFAIGHIAKSGSSFMVYRTGKQGYPVFVPESIMPQLLETGKAEYHNEVDHCRYTETWSIK